MFDLQYHTRRICQNLPEDFIAGKMKWKLLEACNTCIYLRRYIGLPQLIFHYSDNCRDLQYRLWNPSALTIVYSSFQRLSVFCSADYCIRTLI